MDNKENSQTLIAKSGEFLRKHWKRLLMTGTAGLSLASGYGVQELNTRPTQVAMGGGVAQSAYEIAPGPDVSYSISINENEAVEHNLNNYAWQEVDGTWVSASIYWFCSSHKAAVEAVNY